MHIKKWFFLVVLCVACISAMPILCLAQSEIDDTIREYDYSDIDAAIRESTDYNTNFQTLIEDIISLNQGELSIKQYVGKISDMIRANKNAALEILIIGILSAILKNFSEGIGGKQISDTSQMIISLSLVTILAAVFAGAVYTAMDVLDVMIQFYRALCPVFFPAVMVAGGSISAAAYYQIVTMMIAAVDMFFKNVLLRVNSVYMLLGIADSISEEERFSKACEMTQSIIKYVCKTVLAVFLGLSGIKGMISPYLDAEKRSILYRTISLIPGVGNAASAVSKTMLGAGTIVKNSMGVAAVIVIIMISAMPVLKLVVLAVMYKTIAAVLEPIAAKSMVNGVNIFSKAIGNLIQILLVTIALFIMTIGIICMTTNTSYLS